MCDKKIKETLDGSGVPVYRLIFDRGDNTVLPDQYITFQRVGRSPSLNGDDEVKSLTEIWRVTIFSRSNFEDLADSVEALLRADGYGVDNLGDGFEPDTGYYTVPLNCEHEIEKE